MIKIDSQAMLSISTHFRIRLPYPILSLNQLYIRSKYHNNSQPRNYIGVVLA